MNAAATCWEVRHTDIGEGLFALVDIPRGSVILKIWGRTVSFDDTLHLHNKESYCPQIDKDKYIALHFPFFLCNHSCNPNCGINANLEFIAIRDIAKEEELRWDYSTSMMERKWTMKCNCGEPNCRKEVKDFDLLPTETKEKYIEMGIVLPYILKLI